MLIPLTNGAPVFWRSLLFEGERNRRVAGSELLVYHARDLFNRPFSPVVYTVFVYIFSSKGNYLIENWISASLHYTAADDSITGAGHRLFIIKNSRIADNFKIIRTPRRTRIPARRAAKIVCCNNATRSVSRLWTIRDFTSSFLTRGLHTSRREVERDALTIFFLSFLRIKEISLVVLVMRFSCRATKQLRWPSFN